MANHPDIKTCAPLQIQSEFPDSDSGYSFFCWSSLVDSDLSFFSHFFYEVTSNWVTFWVSFQYSYKQPECFQSTAKIVPSNSRNTCGIFLYCPQFFSRLTHPIFGKKLKYFTVMAKEVRRRRQHSPPLAGYNSHLLTVPLQGDPPRLPPFIIWGVDDMKDVSILETESLAWEATVFALVIVKHGSVKGNKDVKAGD